MPNAQRRPIKTSRAQHSSADATEIAKFAALADEWWDPAGKFAPLHRLNPLRLGFIHGVCAQHFGRSARTLRPFDRLSLIDVGCGGGLLSEPLARQGFTVLGIDASPESVAVAGAHAGGADVAPVYRCARAEDIVEEKHSFDVVVALEILEHVADRESFLASCAALAKPGGLLFVATIARTLKALALAKFGAEYVLGWIPPGTHDWNRFISPHELSNEIEGTGLSVVKIHGVSFDPLGWRWRLSSDTGVNYMLAAAKTSKRRKGKA